MPFLQVALPTPLNTLFDYRPPADPGEHPARPGQRVRVPFGRSVRIGLIVGLSEQPGCPEGRIKRAQAILDRDPLLDAGHLELLVWASRYYHHPLGEVIAGALPLPLRQGRSGHPPRRSCWRLTPAGRAVEQEALRRAPRQARLLARLRAAPGGLDPEALAAEDGDWRGALAALAAKGWAESVQRSPAEAIPGAGPLPGPPLNPAQAAVVAEVAPALDCFQPWLLEGVTGSGKTEVYLHLIDGVLRRGRQALVLVPEIALTRQLITRFEARFPGRLAVLHSGLGEQARVQAWLAARDGRADIVIGTRSAVWTPLARPGLFVVDEEHDLSYKQQEGFRYSARDVAVIRAQRSGVPVLLGSATPALESLHNARQGRYRHLQLPERAGVAQAPEISLLDLRGRPLNAGLAEPLVAQVRARLERGEQVLLFINRRGYAPILICHQCGWVAGCHRCDARMTLHAARRELRCHHCDARRPAEPRCPDCGSEDLLPLGQGTERVAGALQALFPAARVLRIDRDSTRQRGAMDAMLDSIHAGEADILVGTQMLSKGHDFPKVTLVGVLDADSRLYGVDFRSTERLAQLVIQVAGRAGRAERPGRVVIQTHHPEHPLLCSLISRGYAAFAEAALEERRAAGLPPYSFLALLRAEATDREAPDAFLRRAMALGLGAAEDGIQLQGPVAAPMERRAGRYRAQLLAQADRRAALQRFLEAWVPGLQGLAESRRVRWSLDVDPQETL